MTLFTRLFLLMIAVGTAPLLPVGALLLHYESLSRISALDVHRGLAGITAVGVRQYIDTLNNRLVFAEDVEAALKSGSGKSAESVLRGAARTNPDFLALALLDKSGREIFKTGRESALKRMGRLNLSGDVVFGHAKATGETTLSAFNSGYELPSAYLVCPLKGGKYIFALIGFSDLWHRIESQSIGRSGRIFLADSDGDLFRFAGSARLDIKQEYLKGLLSGDGGLLESVKAREGVFVGAYRKVDNANLYVIALQLRKEAFWVMKLTTSLIIFFLLAIATTAYFFALYITGKLREPVAELIAGAGRVAARNFDTPVSESGGWGEFAGLIKAFNSMLSEIKRYHAFHIDKLIEEKRKNDLIAGLMRDGLILARPDGEPLLLNKAALAIIEQGRRDEWRGFPAAERDKRIIADMAGQLAGKDYFEIYFGADKRPRSYKAVVENFKSGVTEPVTLVVLRDITLEREMESMKEDFFNAVAHDLRAPLLGLQGYLRLLEDSCRDAKQQEYLESMKVSSSKLFGLIEDILEMARMESGTVSVRIAPFDFGRCVDRVYRELRPLLEAKKLSFETKTGNLEQMFSGDERLIERVLNNLLSNSVKFTPEGGTITVEYGEDGNYYRAAVCDTGPGIPAGKLETVFEKFRQSEAAHEDSGYGLGLAIARKIVELHGGKIRAEAGPGARIAFELPKRPVL